MMLSRLLCALLLCAASRVALAGIIVGASRTWPTREIPYVLPAPSTDWTDENLKKVEEGIRLFNDAKLSVRFKAETKTPAVQYVAFVMATSDKNCNLPAGSPGNTPLGHHPNRKDNKHLVCLDPDLFQAGTVLHELGHVVGLPHEHQYCIRGLYLATKKTGSNYDALSCVPHNNSRGERMDWDYGYDPASVMHYSNDMTLTDPEGVDRLHAIRDAPGRTLGQRVALSAGDRHAICVMYPPQAGQDAEGCSNIFIPPLPEEEQ